MRASILWLVRLMSKCRFDSLIPHAAAAEKVIEREFNDKYCRASPEIIRALNSPEDCPVDLLPWLAFSLSVDVWNDSWNEQTKRAICANAIQLHKTKGLAFGLVDALALLGVRVEVLEWFNARPKMERGTVRLTFWVNEPVIETAAVLIGPELIADLIRQVDQYKRASIHYEFVLAVETTTGQGFAISAGESSQLTRFSAVSHKAKIKLSNAGPAVASSVEFSGLVKVAAFSEKIQARARDVGGAMAASVECSTLLKLDFII